MYKGFYFFRIGYSQIPFPKPQKCIFSNKFLKRLKWKLFIIVNLVFCHFTGVETVDNLAGYYEGNYVIHNFRLENGEMFKDLNIHYRTLGSPQRDSSGTIVNAVLMLHGTNGSGALFLTESIGTHLFASGKPLDLSRYYIILPDAIGSGGSSSPSDGMKAHFPHYQYHDIVKAHHQLITEKLGVTHLHFILGYSMGGMLTWVWGEKYPHMMDALLPIACLPVPVSGRNLILRRAIIESIKNDPTWKQGNYTHSPDGWVSSYPFWKMLMESAQHLSQIASDLQQGQSYVEHASNEAKNRDANNVLYALDASRDYAPNLKQIQARVLAVNFEDDDINPNSFEILTQAILKVKNGNFVLISKSNQTNGHLSFLEADLWAKYVTILESECY